MAEKLKTIINFTVLTPLIVLLMTGCALLDLEQDNNDGPVNLETTFTISNEQMWAGTNSNIISEVYKKFEGEREVSVNVYWPDGNGGHNPVKKIGAGKIENGLLSCEVPEPEAVDLMAWDDFKFEFSAWANTDCVPKAKGTFLRLVTSNNEWLNRETMSGSSDSLWLESIWFIYVDTDCQITGNPSEGTRDDVFYKTPEKLDLTLKRGWNTICRKQLLSGSLGIEADFMTLKNPNDFKWAIRAVP